MKEIELIEKMKIIWEYRNSRILKIPVIINNPSGEHHSHVYHIERYTKDNHGNKYWTVLYKISLGDDSSGSDKILWAFLNQYNEGGYGPGLEKEVVNRHKL